MKRTILKDVGIGLCFLLSTGTIYAQNYPKKSEECARYRGDLPIELQRESPAGTFVDDRVR